MRGKFFSTRTSPGRDLKKRVSRGLRTGSCVDKSVEWAALKDLVLDGEHLVEGPCECAGSFGVKALG